MFVGMGKGKRKAHASGQVPHSPLTRADSQTIAFTDNDVHDPVSLQVIVTPQKKAKEATFIQKGVLSFTTKLYPPHPDDKLAAAGKVVKVRLHRSDVSSAQ